MPRELYSTCVMTTLNLLNSLRRKSFPVSEMLVFTSHKFILAVFFFYFQLIYICSKNKECEAKY